MKEISLQEQKSIMLEMLKSFHEFCQEHGLRYYLTGGTLLGAVRHRGYIPWDDDIDVGMPRKDYEIFSKIYNNEKKEKDYYFYTFHNEPDLYVSSGKLVHTGTMMEEAVDSPVKLGVYLDVFPLDTLGNSRRQAEKLTADALEIRRKLDVQNWKLIKERSWYKNVIIFLIKFFSPKGKRKKLILAQDELCRTYESVDLGAFVGYPCAAMKIELLEGQWYRDRILQPFEQYAFYIPVDYVNVLNVFYGPTFMELPPAEKQKTHHAYHVWYKD